MLRFMHFGLTVPNLLLIRFPPIPCHEIGLSSKLRSCALNLGLCSHRPCPPPPPPKQFLYAEARYATYQLDPQIGSP